MNRNRKKIYYKYISRCNGSGEVRLWGQFKIVEVRRSDAANTENRESDIDIAVVSDGFGKDRFKERVILTKIAYYVDTRIEPHPVNLKGFTDDPGKLSFKRSNPKH